MNNNDIKFSHKSMVDDFGRVFFYNNRVFRKISKNKREDCLNLLQSQMFKELRFKNLLPFTNISEEFSDSEELILEHELLLETLQHEWSFLMFKEAALMLLEVNKICNKYGYELKDAHTLNILFDGCNPMLIDLGSISLKEIKNGWSAYNEFLHSLFVPLLFWSKKKNFIVRKLLESNFHRIQTIPYQSIEDSGLYKLIDIPEKHYQIKFRSRTLYKSSKLNKRLAFLIKTLNFIYKKIINKNIDLFKFQKTVKGIHQLYPYNKIEEVIRDLCKPSIQSQWDGYHNKFYNNKGQIQISERFEEIVKIIKKLDSINSVLDLAGNEGYFSIILSQETNINKIIISDNDENAIDSAFNSIKKLGISNITPVLLNFMFTVDLLGTAKRYRSDLVIALAITHHLILSNHYSLSSIFERLSIFSNKYVIVEFMPMGLWAIGTATIPKIPDWYNLQWFRDNFLIYFELIEEKKLEENRIVFCGKKIIRN